MYILCWTIVAAAWAYLGVAVASANDAASPPMKHVATPLPRLRARWRALRSMPRDVMVRRAAISLWILALFVNAGISVGPVEHLRLVDVAALALLVVCLAARPTAKAAWPDQAIMLLGLAGYGFCIAIFGAANSSTAVLGSIQLAELALVLIALATLLGESDENERRWYVDLFLVVATTQAAFAIGQTLTGTGVSGTSRGEGTLSLGLGFFLAVAFVTAVSRYLERPGQRLRWLLLLLVLAGGMLASQTRTSWMAAFAGTFCLLAFRRVRWAILFACASAALLLALVGMSRIVGWQSGQFGVLERVDSLVQLAQGNGESGGNWTLTKARVAYWKASQETIGHHPFGIGLKNFRDTLPGLVRSRLSPAYWQAADVESPHNQWLSTTVELGLPGGALLLLLLGSVGLAVRRLNKTVRPLAVGLLVLVVVQALVGDVLFGILGMLTIGLLAALHDAGRARSTPDGRYAEAQPSSPAPTAEVGQDALPVARSRR